MSDPDPNVPDAGGVPREHSQEPAEGPDEAAGQGDPKDDVPRVHPEDPAEG